MAGLTMGPAGYMSIALGIILFAAMYVAWRQEDRGKRSRRRRR